MRLHNLKPFTSSGKDRKRRGRGVGSGGGKTSGRGTKGHKSRSGGGVRPGFEGGQMPIHRRLPKRGFKNSFKKEIEIINLRDISRLENGFQIDRELLIKAKLIKENAKTLKVLGDGVINVPLSFQGLIVSKRAKEKIEAVGGKVV